MRLWQRIVGGLLIIGKYPNPEISTDYDVLYAGPGIEVSDEDRLKLEELGWRWDTDYDCWAIFTRARVEVRR